MLHRATEVAIEAGDIRKCLGVGASSGVAFLAVHWAPDDLAFWLEGIVVDV